MLERHPLGSQAFYPTDNKRWLVVVATEPEPQAVRAFWAAGTQGVNYHQKRHHPLLVLEPQQFVIIDRGGDGIIVTRQSLILPFSSSWMVKRRRTKSMARSSVLQIRSPASPSPGRM